MTAEKNSPRENLILVLAFVASAVIGLACVVVPAYMLQDGNIPVPLWPIGQAIEQMQFIPTLFGLLITGIGLGYIQPRYWHLLGLSTVVLLPLIAIVEMAQNSSSHNLWPIEFVLYGVYAFPGFVGAAIGCAVGRRKNNHRLEN